MAFQGRCLTLLFRAWKRALGRPGKAVLGLARDYFFESAFAPFFLSALGFIPFLSFFWLLFPFPMTFPFNKE